MATRTCSAIAVAMVLTVASGLAAVTAAATTTLPGYQWTGGGSSGSGWSSGANWSSGAAPAGSVGTLTFPDLPSCDPPATPTTTCYGSSDDIAGLVASGLTFTGGPYDVTGDSNGDSLTVGADGITVGPQSGGSTPSATLSMPIALGASQTWSIGGSSTSSGPVGSLEVMGGISGSADTLGVDLAGGALLALGGTDEVGSFSVTGADSADTGVGAGTGQGAFLNGTVILPSDLNGQDGDPVDLTDVQASGAGTLGALTATGASIDVGSGGATPGVLATGAASFDSASDVAFAITGSPTSGTTATPGTDNAELTAAANAANSADTGTVALGGAELSIQDTYTTAGTTTQAPTQQCVTPTVGTTYTLVSAPTVTGQFSVVDPVIPTHLDALGNGGTVALPPCGTATASPVALNVFYDTTSSPNSVTAQAVTATTTTLTAPTGASEPITFGSTVTYSAAVAPVSGSGSPTGSVTFTAYPENPPSPTGFTEPYGTPVTLCTATVSSGSASCTAANAPAGTNLVEATYAPDSTSEQTFGGSSGAGIVPVLYDTSTTLTASVAGGSATSSGTVSAGAGQAVVYQATVVNTSASSSSSAPPMGTVTMVVGGSPLCTAALFPASTASQPNQSQATCSSAAAPAGNQPAYAQFIPSIGAPFFPSSSASSSSSTSGLTVDATGAASTVTLTTSATNGSVAAGSSVTYQVTVSSASGGTATPTGTVQVLAGSVGSGVPLCTVTLSGGAGSCTSTAAPTSPTTSTTSTSSSSSSSPSTEPEPVTAVYSGDGTFAGSVDQIELTVTGAQVVVVAAASPASTTAGQGVTYQAAVYGQPAAGSTSAPPSPAGTVTFSAGGTVLCTGTLTAQAHTSDATTTCSSAGAPSGDDTVVAVYGGDHGQEYGGGAADLALTVTAIPTSTKVSTAPTSAAYGQTIDLSAVVSSSSGTPSGGTVSFSVGSTTLCATSPVSAGSATCDTSVIPVGSAETVTAAYSGDSAEGFAGSQGTTQVTVTQATTTTSVSASTTSATAGQSVAYTVTVTPEYTGAPTGTVTVSVGSTAVCTVTLTAADEGSGSCTSTTAPVGTAQTVSATYAGDSDFTGSSGTWSQTLTVTPSSSSTRSATSTTVTVSPIGVAAGQQVTYAATVTGSGSGSIPTGSVAFSVGSTSLCTAVLSGGSGSCTSTGAPEGTDTVTGAYGGDTDDQPSAGTATLTVVAPPPPAPSGSTSSASGTSTSPTGTASASSGSASSGEVTATAQGEGSLTVATYASNPTSGAVADGTGAFYDVRIAPGSDFGSLQVEICDAGAGQSLDWWDGSSWLPFSDQSTANGCLVATVTATTSPTLAQLTGTPVAVSSALPPSSVTSFPTPTPTPSPTPSPSPTPTPTAGTGYRLVGADGGVFAFGAPFDGSLGGVHLAAPIVGVASDPCTGGDWLVGSDGGVFAFGAPFDGSLGGRRLDAPIVGIASYAQDDSSGQPVSCGYWLVGADGGVFAFDAPFAGSLGGRRLDAPIVGMAADPATGGYWLVGADGGVFAFDAPFAGSLGGRRLDAPIVGIASYAQDDSSGQPVSCGYWLVGADGGVFAFGAPFAGSLGGLHLAAPIVGMAADPATGGYWLVGADGGVFAFDAPFAGSLGGLHLAAPVVGIATG